MCLQAHIAYTEYFISCLHYQTYLGFSTQKRPGVCPSICRKKLVYSPGGGGGGGTLIFLYIHRRGSFFLVQNFEFQYFWGFSEKIIFFGGIFFWGHYKIGLYLVVIAMYFRVFS